MKLIYTLIVLTLFTSCAPPKEECRKVYQETYINCKPLPLGQGESCNRSLAEVCEDQYKPVPYGVPR